MPPTSRPQHRFGRNNRKLQVRLAQTKRTLAIQQQTIVSLWALLTRTQHEPFPAAIQHTDTQQESARLDEERLHTILDNLAVGVIQIDAEGRYHYINQRAVARIGRTPEEVIGKSIFDILPPEAAHTELERYRRIIASQSTTEYEMTFDTPNDSWTFAMVGQVLRNPHDAQQTLLISGIDITARKHAEELLAVQSELAHIITTVTSLDEVWAPCLTLAQRITGMDCGGIYLFNPDDEVFELVYHQGLSDEFIAHVTHYPINAPYTHRVLSRSAPYYAFTHDLMNIDFITQEHLLSMVVVPIRDHDTILGCINLGSHTFPNVPRVYHQALEVIGSEIGNIVSYLRTKAALHDSRQRVELALKGANLGMWDWDMRTDRTIFNERWAAIIGYTLAELAPVSFQTWIHFSHPDDFQHSKELLQAHIVGKTPFYECEVRMHHKDGRWVWVRSHGQIVEWDANGQPIRMVGIHLDITAHKEAELALRALNSDLERRVVERTADLQASQKRLALATTSAGIGIWDWDSVTDTLTWDAQMYELYGVTPATFPCTYAAWLNCVHPDDRTAVTSTIEGLRHDEQEYDTEFRVCHPNGDIRVLKAYALIQRDQDGELLRMIGISFDITKRKQAEESLRESEQQLRLSKARLQLLLAKTPAVIFSSLAEGDYHTTFISESVQNVLGYEPSQFMNGTDFWANRLHPGDRDTLFGDTTLLWQQQWCQYEYRCRHADNSYRWVETGVSLLPATAGHPAEVIGYLIDITERKQAEEILRQANRDMARVAQMKDEFLANMSHELRSPLNAILGFSESLQDSIYGSINERQRNALHHIESSSHHLLDLINDILDLSKIEAGKMTIEVEQVNIIEICQTSLLFVRELALKKSIQLLFQSNNQHDLLEADPRRLKQMLINLLSNAVKFTPHGGEVRLEVISDPMAGIVRFMVRDTGIGIAPEDMARLFKPFVQLDSSLSRQHEGTGLGLALVHRLAELHHGTVTVESTLGVGSCFTLILPYRYDQPLVENMPVVEYNMTTENRIPDDTQLHDTVAHHILLVEDNEANIEVIKEYLTVKGFIVTLAQTGSQALTMAIAHQPDLILMDIQIPEIDGLTVTRQLRSLPAFAKTPIIALTALSMPGDQERCLAAGANLYLSKPVVLHELVQQMSQLLYQGKEAL